MSKYRNIRGIALHFINPNEDMAWSDLTFHLVFEFKRPYAAANRSRRTSPIWLSRVEWRIHFDLLVRADETHFHIDSYDKRTTKCCNKNQKIRIPIYEHIQEWVLIVSLSLSLLLWGAIFAFNFKVDSSFKLILYIVWHGMMLASLGTCWRLIIWKFFKNLFSCTHLPVETDEMVCLVS